MAEDVIEAFLLESRGKFFMFQTLNEESHGQVCKIGTPEHHK